MQPDGRSSSAVARDVEAARQHPGGSCRPTEDGFADAGWQTVPDVLRWRAARHPEQLAYRFLPDGESGAFGIGYGELDRHAREIAAALLLAGVHRGDRVLLLYPPGLEFVAAWFGCAYAAAIAVVLPGSHPARARRLISNVAAIAADAQPALGLTTVAIRDGSLAVAEGDDSVLGVRWLATDGALERGDTAPGRASGGDIALLQYTSGSTSTPRGVMVTHDNLMHNLRAIRGAFWAPTDGSSVCWLPPHHDMGLVGGILAPLYFGLPATLMPPVAFVQRPRRWLQAIGRYGAAVSGGPNFAYDLCVRRITPEQRVGLDLSGWRVAFNGAEPVTARTIRAFTAHFAPCGFRPDAFKPCYGLAEATLLVSVNVATAPPRVEAFRQDDLASHKAVPCGEAAGGGRALVSCGRPTETVVIVDPVSGRPCSPGHVGEIWVRGASVARGYWGRRAATEEIFHARFGDEDTGPYLRTGDLGFLFDGELFATGRLKDLIIVDGTNHYPHDIERTVEGSHGALEAGDCAALGVETPDGEALVVIVAIQRSARPDGDAVRRAIRTAVSEQHDVRVHDVVLVTRGSIPRTSSGKIRRHACREAYVAGTLSIWEGR